MKLNIKALFLCGLCFLLSWCSVASAQTGNLEGVIIYRWKQKNKKLYKEGNRIVEDLAKNVLLLLTYEDEFDQVRTNQDGYFKFESLNTVEWSFDVKEMKGTKLASDPYPQKINVCVGCTNRANIILTLPFEDRAWVRNGKASIVLAFHSTRTTSRFIPVVAAQEQRPQGSPQQQKEKAERLECLSVVKGAVGKHLRAGITLNGVRVSAYGISKQTQRTFVLDRQQTDEKGRYVLNLPQDKEYDTYVLTFNQTGYNSEIRIQPCDAPPPTDIVLKTLEEAEAEAAEASEQQDEVEATIVPPFEATRRYVFYPRLMQALPLREYRSFDEFALLAPGVLPPPQTFGNEGPGVSPGVGSAGQFSVNGLRPRENNFSIDGSDNNDEDIGIRRQGFVSLTPQPVETLQEFQVITALPDATYGRSMGGQVNALTQSGGTDLHGSLYGFHTDNAINARDFFDGTTRGNPSAFELRRSIDNAPVLLDDRPLVVPNPVGGKNALRRTQAGFLLGGHILRTDTFYFASFERKVNRENREAHFAVPTIRQRGVFESGETGFRADGVPLYPASIPGNAVFSLYPFPNNPLGPYGQNTYTAVLPADADASLFTLKLNQRFGEIDERNKRPWWAYFVPLPMHGDLFTARYNITQDKNRIPVTGGALFSALRPRVRTQNPSFFLNRRLSNNVSDTIRFSFGRTRLLLQDTLSPAILPSAFFPDVPFLLNAPLLLNITAPTANGMLNPTTRYFSASSPQGTALLNLLGYSSITQTEQITGPLGQVIIPGFSPVGVDVYHYPQSRANNTFQLADTLRYTRETHSFTFGGDVRKTQINSTLDRNFSPLAQFNGLRNSSTPLPLLGVNNVPLAQQFLSGATLAAAGAPTGLFQTLAVVPDSTIGIRYTQLNFFAQDEWSVRQNLRLTLGVRYELNTVPDTVGRKVESALDPETLRQLAQDAAQTCNVGRCDDLVGALTSAFPANFKISFGSDRNDFDIRFGFAFDPGYPGKAVVRGGFGVYSGQFPGIVLSQSRNAFPNFLPLNFATFSPRDSVTGQQFLFNPSNPILQQLDPGLAFFAPGTLNTLQAENPVSVLSNQLRGLQRLLIPPTVLGLDLVLPQKNLRTPYALHYGIIVERQLFADYYISASYVGTRGFKLLRVTTPDLGMNNSSVSIQNVQALGQVRFPYFTGSELPAQSLVISKAFAIARTFFESSAASTYNSIQLELRKRYANRFQLGSALTYSHSLDDASDFFDSAGGDALPQNSLQRSEKASSSFDVRWRWVTHFLYDAQWDIPFIRRASGKGLGGWRIAGILTAQTGQPFTVNSAFDINRDGNLTDRLNNTDGLIAESAEGDASTRLLLAPEVNPQTLLAADGKDGAVGRNTFRAPGIFTFDLSVMKNLNFNDRHKFYVGAEFFNLFNRTHFAIPERILESPAFGRSVRTIIPARRIQLKFNYSF